MDKEVLTGFIKRLWNARHSEDIRKELAEFEKVVSESFQKTIREQEQRIKELLISNWDYKEEREVLKVERIALDNKIKELEERCEEYRLKLQPDVVASFRLRYQEKEKLIQRVRELEEALMNLCELKVHKDVIGKDAFYEEQQPLVWKRANELLSKLIKNKINPANSETN